MVAQHVLDSATRRNFCREMLRNAIIADKSIYVTWSCYVKFVLRKSLIVVHCATIIVKVLYNVRNKIVIVTVLKLSSTNFVYW